MPTPAHRDGQDREFIDDGVDDEMEFEDWDDEDEEIEYDEYGADILCDCAECSCRNVVNDYGELCRLCRAGEHR